MLSEKDYRAVFDASPDGCLVVDGEGLIQGANHRVEDMFGWSPEELIGQAVEVLVPHAARSAHTGHRERFVGNPHARPMGAGLELRGQRRDGSDFPVEVSLSPWAKDGEAIRVICSVRDVSAYRRLRNFSEGALRAGEEERRRISRELHDDIAQRLATLVLHVRRLANGGSPEFLALVERIRTEIVEASDAVRRLARGLRPPELEDAGLALALQAHVRGMSEATGFRVETELERIDGCLDSTEELALYRIVQEALANAFRHANVSGAFLSLKVVKGKVVAEIGDEGQGFDLRHDIGDSSLGIVGMQERAAVAGARLDIDTRPGRGTRVRVSLPCRNIEEEIE